MSGPLKNARFLSNEGSENMTSYQRRCVRCRETHDIDVEFPETSMNWLTDVDYLDFPETDN